MLDASWIMPHGSRLMAHAWLMHGSCMAHGEGGPAWPRDLVERQAMARTWGAPPGPRAGPAPHEPEALSHEPSSSSHLY